MLATRLSAQGAFAAVLAGLLLLGCGSTPPAGLSPGAAAKLRSDLDGIQASASGHDAAGAARALSGFAADVAAQHSAGHLASSEYAALETGIARTRARIPVEVTPPVAVATTPAYVPPAAPQPVAPVTGPGPGQDQGKGKGKGKDKGKGKGNGGH